MIWKRCAFEPRALGAVDWDEAGGEAHPDGELPGAVLRHD